MGLKVQDGQIVVTGGGIPPALQTRDPDWLEVDTGKLWRVLLPEHLRSMVQEPLQSAQDVNDVANSLSDIAPDDACAIANWLGGVFGSSLTLDAEEYLSIASDTTGTGCKGGPVYLEPALLALKAHNPYAHQWVVLRAEGKALSKKKAELFQADKDAKVLPDALKKAAVAGENAVIGAWNIPWGKLAIGAGVVLTVGVGLAIAKDWLTVREIKNALAGAGG